MSASVPSALRVGVDIGGIFTDLVLRLPDGALRVSKVSSTPDDPGLAVVDGLAALLRAAGVAPADVTEIVHGTTVAANTILQKTGAVTGLITTASATCWRSAACGRPISTTSPGRSRAR